MKAIELLRRFGGWCPFHVYFFSCSSVSLFFFAFPADREVFETGDCDVTEYQ